MRMIYTFYGPQCIALLDTSSTAVGEHLPVTSQVMLLLPGRVCDE